MYSQEQLFSYHSNRSLLLRCRTVAIGALDEGADIVTPSNSRNLHVAYHLSVHVLIQLQRPMPYIKFTQESILYRCSLLFLSHVHVPMWHIHFPKAYVNPKGLWP